MRILLAILFFCCILPQTAKTQDTASAGSWSLAAIWQSGTSPADGNVLVIPVGVTVTVDCNCGTYDNMHIIVLGTLDFPAGRKINLTANGIVDIHAGGRLTGSNGGSKLNIGGNTVWRGNEPDLVGPQTCLSGGCNVNLTLPVELLSFKCFLNESNQLRAEWVTATETNNDYFTLYTSYYGDDWTIASTFMATGESIEPVKYAYEVNYNDDHYCQLSQTDVDGQTEILAHSEIVTNASSVDDNYQICNPCQSQIRLRLNDFSGDLALVSSNGVRLYSAHVKPFTEVEISNKPRGVYFVILENEFVRYTDKIVLQ